MKDYGLLVEQHIKQHEAKLKHVDELLDEARGGAKGTPAEPELTELSGERDMLARELDALRGKSIGEFEKEEIQKAGPMGAWDALAQQIERFIEKLGR